MTYQYDCWAAVADPTRRLLLERLVRGPLPVGRLAAGLPVSRPAVSQHLKVLKEAGLVIDQADGTKRIYRIDPAGLGQIRRWLDQFRDASLAAFAAEADRVADAGTNRSDADGDDP